MKQIWITDEAHKIARNVSFKDRLSIGTVVSLAVESNKEYVEKSRKVEMIQ